MSIKRVVVREMPNDVAGIPEDLGGRDKGAANFWLMPRPRPQRMRADNASLPEFYGTAILRYCTVQPAKHQAAASRINASYPQARFYFPSVDRSFSRDNSRHDACLLCGRGNEWTTGIAIPGCEHHPQSAISPHTHSRHFSSHPLAGQAPLDPCCTRASGTLVS